MRPARHLVGLVALLVGCGSSSGSSNALAPNETPPPAPSQDNGTSGDGTDAGMPSMPDTDAGAPDATPPNEQGCTDASKLVYVVSQENDLYSFMPSKLAFTKIGALTCATTGTSANGATPKPESMSLDRNGTAWVVYDDGELFKVSTADASCTPTSYEPGQHGFTKLGMAFSMDSASATNDSLFVSGIDYANGGFVGKGIASIDTTSLSLTPIGDFTAPLAKKAAELTGTGDGKLYGFFTTSPATLAEIDKTSGATMSTHTLTGVDVGDAWAFSFWGGDFWFYTAPSLTTSPGSTTTITQYKVADDTIKVVKKSIGFRIVGAGVSTCVPLAGAPPTTP
jgi:hypothetical protein